MPSNIYAFNNLSPAIYAYAEDYRKQARLDPYAGCYLTYRDIIDERM